MAAPPPPDDLVPGMTHAELYQHSAAVALCTYINRSGAGVAPNQPNVLALAQHAKVCPHIRCPQPACRVVAALVNTKANPLSAPLVFVRAIVDAGEQLHLWPWLAARVDKLAKVDVDDQTRASLAEQILAMVKLHRLNVKSNGYYYIPRCSGAMFKALDTAIAKMKRIQARANTILGHARTQLLASLARRPTADRALALMAVEDDIAAWEALTSPAYALSVAGIRAPSSFNVHVVLAMKPAVTIF